jgi:hypothetical protein
VSSNITIGPIAPENNPPIMPDFYLPRVFYIEAIQTGATTLITTTLPHNYVVGQTVRLLIPSTYGARLLNEQQGQVIAIPAPNQVKTSIYSLNSDAFIASPAYGPTPPQIIPIGDINNGGINNVINQGYSNRTTQVPQTICFIPGSFIDISPAPGNTADIPTPGVPVP